MDWIMSEGGPLICMERRFESSWGGVEQISYRSPGSETDYDRACKVSDYLSSIPLREGSALVIGDEPLDTSVWRSPSGELYIVRAIYAPSNADYDKIMFGIVPSLFDFPEEVLDFSVREADLAIFDSAEPGSVIRKKAIRLSLSPGNYRISTQIFDPDDNHSLILHRFQLMT